ncbi:MAG TPA: caspase family protein [Pyrinomonadaceae bacterium]
MPGFKRSLAVVLGINTYGNDIPPLRTAANDARAVATLLEQRHGYDVLLHSDGDVSLSKIRELLNSSLSRTVGPEDRVLFYFAGHGVAADGDDGPVGYLIPQDARRDDVSTFLPMQELHDALTALPCRHMLVILDCCFAGAFRWSSTRDLRPVPAVLHRERYERFILDPAWQAITSAAHDQKALDVLAGEPVGRRGDGQSHSPFARALLSALEGDADVVPLGGDGVITATELYLYLRDEVESGAASDRMRQTAGLWPLRRHDKGEYIFLSPKKELSLPPAPVLTEETNPYRGLKPYEERHRHLFFGRERVIGQLHRAVRRLPLTAVVGASGTGKSSVVKAGLLPRLRSPDSKRWRVLSPVRPGTAPVQALVNLLSSPDENVAEDFDPKTNWKSDVKALTRLVGSWAAKNPGTKLLLVIDQAEELVTLCKDEGEREHFLSLLDETLKTHPRQFRLVMTVRADFEPQFASSAFGGLWQTSRFVVPPMTQDELRETIEGPASAAVIYFDPPQLVDRLINEVVQMPGALPLLSFTLSEMYFGYLRRRGDDRALNESDYKALGGVAGALRRRASDEFESLPDAAHRDTMRRLLLRMVALEGGETARRRVPREELIYLGAEENGRVAAVVRRLSEARLLVEDQDADDRPTIEPAHDALVRGWDTLWKWIVEEQDNILLQRRLTVAAMDWRGAGPNRGHLWDNDPRLPQLEAQLNSGRKWLNSLETEFVERSIRRRRQRRLTTIGIVTAAFLVLAGFTYTFYSQRNEARRLRLVSTSQAMAAQAPAQHEQQGQDERAALLARQAYLFNLDNDGANEAQIDAALRSVLGLAYFSNFLGGHAAVVNSVAFGPDGSRLASASGDATVRVWDLRHPEERPRVLRHDSPVFSIDIHPHLPLLVSGGDDGTLRLWDLSQPASAAREVARLGKGVNVVRFSRDGNVIAAGDNDGAVRLYRWQQDGASPVTFSHQSAVKTLAFGADDQVLAVGDEGGSISLWDLRRTGSAARVLKAGAHVVYSIAFDKDGGRLAAGNLEGSVLMWDLSRPSQAPRTLMEAGVPWVGAVCFSPDGGTLAATVSDGTTRLWNLRQPAEAPLVLHGDRSASMSAAFSPDGNSIATSADTGVRLVDLRPSAALPARLGPINSAVYSVGFSPDGQRLASAGHDGQLRVWDLRATASPTHTLRGSGNSNTSVAFSPDGSLLAAGSANDDNDLRVWDLRQPAAQPVLFSGHKSWIRSVAFSPDGRLVASGSLDETIRLWEVGDARKSPVILRQHSRVLAVAFSRDGNRLLSGDEAGGVYLWNVGSPLAQPLILKPRADGTNPFQQPSPVEAEEVDLSTLESQPRSGVWSVAFSADGTHAASGSEDGVVRLWNLNNLGRGPVELRGHETGVSGVAFRPDGEVLASCGKDGTVRLWDVLQPQTPPVVLRVAAGEAFSVAYSPDGRTLASAYLDGSIYLWIGDTEILASLVCDKVRRNLTNDEWVQFVGQDVEYERTCPNLPPPEGVAESP